MKKVLSFLIHFLFIFSLFGCVPHRDMTNPRRIFEKYTKWVSDDENLILYSYLTQFHGYAKIRINNEYVLTTWDFVYTLTTGNVFYLKFYENKKDYYDESYSVFFHDHINDYSIDSFAVDYLRSNDVELDDKWESWSSTMTKYPLDEYDMDAKYYLLGDTHWFENETYGLKFEYYNLTYDFKGETHKHYDNSYFSFRFFGEYYNKDLVLAFLDNSTFKIEYFYNGRGIGSTGKYYSKQGKKHYKRKIIKI